MKTYAESHGKTPFDWNKTLLDLIKRDKNNYLYNRNIEFSLEQLAGNWVTCACGNQCEIIQRDKEYGKPLDKKLRDLGNEFYDNIRECDWENALNKLHLIEIRSTELIKQLNLTYNNIF